MKTDLPLRSAIERRRDVRNRNQFGRADDDHPAYGSTGADAILATAPDGAAMGALIGGLTVRGKLIVVGVGLDPIPVGTLPLIFGGRSVHGSLTGTAIDNQDTLDFSVLQNVRPIIETVPLAQAVDAYARMMAGKARFRMVLTHGPATRRDVNSVEQPR